jgi:hypothetical protein
VTADGIVYVLTTGCSNERCGSPTAGVSHWALELAALGKQHVPPFLADGDAYWNKEFSRAPIAWRCPSSHTPGRDAFSTVRRRGREREEMKLDCSTPEGEHRLFIYSAARAKQQEKDNYQTTENGNGKQRKTTESRPRDPDPWSPPENPFPTSTPRGDRFWSPADSEEGGHICRIIGPPIFLGGVEGSTAVQARITCVNMTFSSTLYFEPTPPLIGVRSCLARKINIARNARYL